MLFEVIRTSYPYWENKCPHEKCYPIKLTRVETAPFTTPEEYDQRYSRTRGMWLKIGKNHRVNERGFITRDVELDTYGIELNSLEELMDLFADVNENIVLQKSWFDNKTPCLEIYDDYRE